MFSKRNRKRLIRVEISFKSGEPALPKEIIEVLPGQHFQTDIGHDELWEGNTLIKEWDWRAGYTKTYEYFYV